MIDPATLPYTVTLPACFLGGLVLGYIYFRALRLTANLIVSHGHPLLGLALTFGRLALLGAGFYVAVLAGALALLAALAGVLGAKALMLRQYREAG
ncbi:ATP synthase subunit I [Frigidibacter sp. ROC022]|uniref:ATP synthase subunit I n=1 Tax=Frigidibacter sp. ROC022 TaxID=2971796 RepID=UPI00215AAB3E|nr:ATP synthase subunit I [Frigidibacter sp. ROC022]MCR8723805.1 ATP synthase subunit I [Frigidibacter sp. ROC022]